MIAFAAIVILAAVIILNTRIIKEKNEEIAALTLDLEEGRGRERALLEENQTLKADLSDLRERS